MKHIYRLLLLIPSCLGNFAYATDYDATIEFPPPYELSLPVSGVIKTLKVTAGQRISKGDEILALDSTPFRSAITYAQSRITVQQTVLTESQRDFKQQQELYDRTVLALVELENAELRVKRDRAALDVAQAQLADAEYAFSYSKLVAPFDALVLSVHANQGQSINNALQSKSLILLVRQGHYQARFLVSIDDLEKIKIDQPVTVKSMGKQYQGKITSINYQPLAEDIGKDKRFMIAAEFISQDATMPISHEASVHIADVY